MTMVFLRSRLHPDSYRLGPVPAAAATIIVLGSVAGWSITRVDMRLAFAVAFGLVAFAAFVVRPFESMVCFGALWGTTHVVFADVTLAQVGSFHLTVSRAVGLLLVGGLLTALAGPYGFALAPRGGRPVLMLLVAFGLLFAAGLAVVSTTSDGTSDTLRIAGAVTVCLASYTFVSSRRQLLILSGAVAAGAVVGAAIAIFEFLLIKSDASLAYSIFGTTAVQQSSGPAGVVVKRAAGPLGGADESAGVFVIAFCFALLVYALRREGRRDLWAVVAMTLLAAGVAATVTRTAAAALIIGTAVWAIQSQSRRLSPAGTRIAAGLTSVALIVGLVAALGVNTIENRLSDVNPSGPDFAQGRSSIWQSEIDNLRNTSVPHLLVGQGPHSSYLVVAGIGDAVQARAPHNILLWLLVDTGVAGLLLFGLFLAALARAYLQVARSQRYTDAARIASVGLAGLACFLTLSVFGNTVVSPGIGWYFLLFVGATLRGSLLNSDHTAEQPHSAEAADSV